MWLMTQHGFYSIVQKQPREYQVRARVRRDLENVLGLMEWEHDIIEGEGTDYPYRIKIPRYQLLDLLARFGGEIDYDNFKNRIHELPDQKAKSSAYARVWGVMAGVQP